MQMGMCILEAGTRGNGEGMAKWLGRMDQYAKAIGLRIRCGDTLSAMKGRNVSWKDFFRIINFIGAIDDSFIVLDCLLNYNEFIEILWVFKWYKLINNQKFLEIWYLK